MKINSCKCTSRLINPALKKKSNKHKSMEKSDSNICNKNVLKESRGNKSAKKNCKESSE